MTCLLMTVCNDKTNHVMIIREEYMMYYFERLSTPLQPSSDANCPVFRHEGIMSIESASFLHLDVFTEVLWNCQPGS